MKVIEHVIPQIGPIKIELFEPSEEVYNVLFKNNEVVRLSKLRHLGALSFALEGARLARWDYTVALVYYASKLSVAKFNSSFNIGRVAFSSCKAALQVASLVWNIGHLPGTFSVEKGVYRYLSSHSSMFPASSLDWKFRTTQDVKLIIKKSNELLVRFDFYGLSKVLAVLKLLSWCESENDFLYKLTVDFIAPLFLDYDLHYSKQWAKLREGFKLIRHISYLTLDTPFSGDSWITSMPDFFESQVRRYSNDIYLTSSKISEPLSPLELNIYERLYHCRKARFETAIYAAHVNRALKSKLSVPQTISEWLKSGLTRDLRLGKRYKHSQINSLLSIKFRTHFSQLNDAIVKVERNLESKGYCHSTIHKYHSWNSDTLLEPDQYIIDVLKKGSFTSGELGKLIIWVMDNFDDFECTQDDFISIAKKVELESAYKDAFEKAVKRIYNDIDIEFNPWPLNDLGIFPSIPLQDTKGGAWAAKGKMGETVTRHILRDRRSRIERHQYSLYKELSGIRKLRQFYRGSLNIGTTPRCRWVLFTSSIIFVRNGQPFIEFDGGILKISTRSGALTWYALETKTGNENPAASLRKRLKRHGIQGKVKSLSTTHAYVEMQL